MTFTSDRCAEGSEETTCRGAPKGSDLDTTTAPGTEVAGRYWVIDILGSGGMGHVYRAYDPRLGREVALKQLRVASHDAEVRLAREARAMAQLNHPNVVAVYDVVTEASGVTLAMEYVPGETLRQWLKSPRSWREVVAAFVEAGRGLQAAHRAGFVHRDFKPSNVLMAQDGRIRVTDFGVAKSTRGASDSARSESEGGSPGYDEDAAEPLTEFGALIGTPKYMSPEQHDAAEADAHSDQYAYCLALWEALSGASPFPGPSRRLAQQKTEGPPPWPAAVRVPRKIAAAVERGLRLRPTDRWPTMRELIEALDAGQGTGRARASRGAAVVFIGGAIGATVWITRATDPCASMPDGLPQWSTETADSVREAFAANSMPFAERTATVVIERIDAYTTEWVTTMHDSCQATLVRAEQSPAMMDRATLCLERSRVRLVAAIETVRQRAATEDIDNLPRMLAELPELSRCRDTQWLSAEVQPPIGAQQTAEVDALEAVLAGSEATIATGDAVAGLASLTAMAARVEATHYPPLIARVALVHGKAARETGRNEDAEIALRRAYTLALTASDDRTAMDAARELGRLLGYHLAQSEEGLLLLDTALALAQRPGVESRALVATRSARATVLQRLGRNREALAELRGAHQAAVQQFPPVDLTRTTVATALGAALYDSGLNEDALALHRTVLATLLRTVGVEHPSTAIPRINVGVALDGLGRSAEASEQFLEARRVAKQAYGEPHSTVALCNLNLSVAKANLGETELALEFAAVALRGHRSIHGEQHILVARSHAVAATALVLAHRLPEAEAEFRVATTLAQNLTGPSHPFVLYCRLRLARALLLAGKLDVAEREILSLAPEMEAALPVPHAEFGLLWETQGEILLAAGRPHQAVVALRRATAVVDTGQMRPVSQAIIRFKLARALSDAGHSQLARTMAREARATLVPSSDRYAADRALVADIEAWLAAPPHAEQPEPRQRFKTRP
ncbi:MAG: serine/threonine protein kinase [Nannocystaceae bacterium]|nr:serine/threonine protein kinase [Nannocystaceae bacterium]